MGALIFGYAQEATVDRSANADEMPSLEGYLCVFSESLSPFVKSDCHVLAELVPEGLIGPEVIEKLDSIVKVAQDARPLEA